jgi:lincosamide nucleotidyltransferase A/C/D/E
MEAEDVVELYSLLVEHGVQVWIGGGWGIDALLKEQTRSHKDLDAFVQFDDLGAMTNVLAECRFTLKEIWSENRWISHPLHIQLIGRMEGANREVATAFVLQHEHGNELDFHVLQFDNHGNGIPLWDDESIYPPEAFEGSGLIMHTPVRGLSAKMQMATHTGYELQPKDLQDLRLLHERFGTPYLEQHAHLFQE